MKVVTSMLELRFLCQRKRGVGVAYKGHSVKLENKIITFLNDIESGNLFHTSEKKSFKIIFLNKVNILKQSVFIKTVL